MMRPDQFIRALRESITSALVGDFTFGSAQITLLASRSILYPTEMAYNQLKGLDNVQNFERVGDLPVPRAELVRRGYSSVDIAKFFGGNWIRVFRQAWKS